jgi:CubicO group peptidase (beta-lactamase class C family)
LVLCWWGPKERRHFYVSEPFPGVQAVVDEYTSQHPQIGMVVGAVTPDVPDGGLVTSTNEILVRSHPYKYITVDGTTPFEIGSVSKVFTTGIFQCRQTSFDGTLAEYFPNPTEGRNPFTLGDVGSIPVQDIAWYTSGLPQDNGHCARSNDTPFAGHTGSLSELFGFLNGYNPADPPPPKPAPWPPGKSYTYSNLAMSLLGMAALKGELTSTDDDAFAETYNKALMGYCQQFGVDTPGNTTTIVYSLMAEMGIPYDSLPCGYVTNYQLDNAVPCAIPEYGSGGIVSNGNDMLQFLLFCMGLNGPAYPLWMQKAAATRKRWCKGGDETTGYGWFVSPTVDNQWLATKDGGVAGFTAWIVVLNPPPPSGTSYGLFILTNGPDATTIGPQAFSTLFPEGKAPQFPDATARSFDAHVH